MKKPQLHPLSIPKHFADCILIYHEAFHRISHAKRTGVYTPIPIESSMFGRITSNSSCFEPIVWITDHHHKS